MVAGCLSFILCGLFSMATAQLTVFGRPAMKEGPVRILDGAPLSNSAPPWSLSSHSLIPSPLWGLMGAPYPTNAWWQNLTLGSGENIANVLPYTIKVRSDGLHMCRPSEVVTQTFIITAFLDNLVFGAAENLGVRNVISHDDLSVTMQWKSGDRTFTSPLVRGMPYVTGIYDAFTPEIRTQHAILEVNGMPAGNGATFSGSRFDIKLNNGQRWLVYAPASLTFVAGFSRLTAVEPYSGALRAAIAPSGSDALLDAYASCIPVGGNVSASSFGNKASLVFEWETVGRGELLMMTLPHHRDILKGVQEKNFNADTIKGEMRAVSGKRWVLQENLTQISWSASEGIDPLYEDSVRLALAADVGQQVLASDTYFGGKQLAKLGRLALIADELGELGLAATYRENLKSALQPWLNGVNPVPLVYDTTWGGLVASNAISNPGAGFGQGYYNDHHFHYGYFIYAAAALAKEDPGWKEENREAVLHLVRDIANPSDLDSYYTSTRNMDWFVGHSWASGLFEFGDASNQESTSEAVNAWYGVYLWGLVCNEPRLRDLGRLMLATEIRSAQRYWQITSESDIYPSPFADTKVVGVLWSTKVDYATFFGNAVEFIHGIQMLPFTPISEELLRPDWIVEEYPVVATGLPTASEGWKGFIYMAHAVINAPAAWVEAGTLVGYDDGNTRTNTLYWIATRP
jgi:endo-1,3(4)-beta-glucanase